MEKPSIQTEQPTSSLLERDAFSALHSSLHSCLPDEIVRDKISLLPAFTGKLYVVAIGKAAWQMAKTAYECLGFRITRGIVITKHGYSKGPIGTMEIMEAGHPVPDQNTYCATEQALEMTSGLSAEDLVLFLISGGGSSLFEKSAIPVSEMASVTEQLLKCGASIAEINIIRKHLSLVKGGKFAEHCLPATVVSIILSDVIGNRLDTIASGPSAPDQSTSADALKIIDQYHLTLSSPALESIRHETPKELHNVIHWIGGSVVEFCRSFSDALRSFGYETTILSDTFTGDADSLADEIESIVRKNGTIHKHAWIWGGEPTVQVRGNGKGGRCQQIALDLAIRLRGIPDFCFLAAGSDGTDGPTDASGAIIDGTTYSKMQAHQCIPENELADNNAYYALQSASALVFTGPTGTNVNDIYVCIKK